MRKNNLKNIVSSFLIPFIPSFDLNNNDIIQNLKAINYQDGKRVIEVY